MCDVNYKNHQNRHITKKNLKILNSKEEVRDCFLESTMELCLLKGELNHIVSDDSKRAIVLIMVERIVRDILLSNERLFFVSTSRYGEKYFDCEKPGHGIITAIEQHDLDGILSSFPIHEFHPYAKLFIDTVKDKQVSAKEMLSMRIFDEKIQVGCVNMLNGFVDKIRKDALVQEIEKKKNNHERLANKNYSSLVKYVNALFKKFSRLLVVRVDFGYRKDSDIVNNNDMSAKYLKAKKDFEHMFNNRRGNKIFDHMVGYAAKIEHGLMKGFHLHAILFFGPERQRDVNIATRIGEYWVKVITKGEGVYFNCNAKKQSYKHLGIGKINHNDIDLRENLETRVCAYLTKPDFYAKIIAHDDGRTFFRGKMPKPKITKVGRPRKGGSQTCKPK